MKGMRISGKEVHVMLGAIMLCIENYTLNIEDGTTVAMTRGVPDGYLDGDTKASGEIELDSKNFELISKAAKNAGSYKGMETFDIVSGAESDEEKISVEAFGCKIKISDIMNAKGSGGEKLTYKLPFDVTSPDFVKINGVPYLKASETKNLN